MSTLQDYLKNLSEKDNQPFEILTNIDISNIKDQQSLIDNFNESNIKVNSKLSESILELSSKHTGNQESVFKESLKIVDSLKEKGHSIISTKIFTDPNFSEDPIINDIIPIPNDCYFESIISISSQSTNLYDFVEFLNESLDSSQSGGVLHLSQNQSNFTLSYKNNLSNYDSFLDEVDLVKHSLSLNQFEFDKEEIRYFVYDSNFSDVLIEEKIYENV